MGGVEIQRVMSEEVGSRRFFLSPPEPPPDMLMGSPSGAIYIGRTKLMSVPFFWDFRRLANPHIAVMGISGSGKSYLVKSFLTRAALVLGANALIIDWAGEYRRWVEQAGGKVIELGKGERINLLDLGGMRPSDRIRQVVASFEMLTDIGGNQHQLRFVELALERVYGRKGFALNEKANGAGRERSPPTLFDLVAELRRTGMRGLSPAMRDELEQAVHKVRKLTMPGTDCFAKGTTISLEGLARGGLVCIDLHSLPSEQMRSLAGLTILQFIKELMRDEGWKPEKGVKLFVVADEAWKIAKDERSDLISIVREGRKYQFGLIVASQNPTDLNSAILANAGTIFIMRMLLKEHKDYVQGSLGYGEFIKSQMEGFGVGEAAVHLVFEAGARFNRTFLLRRIDGEEPLASFVLGGGSVELEFEKHEFRRRLLGAGLSDAQAAEVSLLFERGGCRLEAHRLALALEKYGFGRSAILAFLRDLGIGEPDLVDVFAKVSRAKLGADADKIAELVVKDV